MDNIPISDDQLAYLNDSLDLVGECVEIWNESHHVLEDNTTFNCTAVTRTTVTRGPAWHNWVSVHTNMDSYGVNRRDYIWRKLLQYVEDNQQPPIFK